MPTFQLACSGPSSG